MSEIAIRGKWYSVLEDKPLGGYGIPWDDRNPQPLLFLDPPPRTSKIYWEVICQRSGSRKVQISQVELTRGLASIVSVLRFRDGYDYIQILLVVEYLSESGGLKSQTLLDVLKQPVLEIGEETRVHPDLPRALVAKILGVASPINKIRSILAGTPVTPEVPPTKEPSPRPHGTEPQAVVDPILRELGRLVPTYLSRVLLVQYEANLTWSVGSASFGDKVLGRLLICNWTRPSSPEQLWKLEDYLTRWAADSHKRWTRRDQLDPARDLSETTLSRWRDDSRIVVLSVTDLGPAEAGGTDDPYVVIPS